MHWGLEKTCFRRKTLSQSDSIESADQTRFFPYFHAGRETLLMQADVGFHDIFAQPCSRFFHPQIAAGLNHFMECLVKTDSILFFVHKSTHGVRNVNLVRENHKPFQGHHHCICFHGKHTKGICHWNRQGGDGLRRGRRPANSPSGSP